MHEFPEAPTGYYWVVDDSEPLAHLHNTATVDAYACACGYVFICDPRPAIQEPVSKCPRCAKLAADWAA